MIYGYARCSTNESKQDINRQIKELKTAGATAVIFEYEHGDAKTKKELAMLLELVQAGDTIITLEVSRLSRSTQQLCELIDTIREKRLFMNTVQLNLRSVFMASQAAVKHMAAQGGGSSSNISSVGGAVPDISQIAYGTSKAAINYLTKLIAVHEAKITSAATLCYPA